MNDSQRLMKVMEYEHLNAKQFAEAIGISAGTLSNIFGGRNNPSLEVVKAVIRHFHHINPDWFFDETETASYYRDQTAASNGAPQADNTYPIIAPSPAETSVSAKQPQELSLFSLNADPNIPSSAAQPVAQPAIRPVQQPAAVGSQPTAPNSQSTVPGSQSASTNSQHYTTGSEHVTPISQTAAQPSIPDVGTPKSTCPSSAANAPINAPKVTKVILLYSDGTYEDR